MMNNNLEQYKNAIEDYKKRIMDLNIESRSIIREFETLKQYKNHKHHNPSILLQEFELFIHSTIIKFMKKLDISENTFKQILPMCNDYTLLIEQFNYYKNEYEKYKKIASNSNSKAQNDGYLLNDDNKNNKNKNINIVDDNTNIDLNSNSNSNSSSNSTIKRKRSRYDRFQLFKYNVNNCNIETHITTQQLANQLVKVLNEEQITLNLFAKRVLGVSRVIASKLISNPRSWSKIPKPTVKHFKIIYLWLNDEERTEKLKVFMRKIQIVTDTNTTLQADLARQLLPNTNTVITTTPTATTTTAKPIKPTPIYKSQPPLNERLDEKPQLTKQQTSFLTSFYQRNSSPTHDEMTTLSQNLNIDYKYVRHWFENMKINDNFNINNNQLELLQQIYSQNKQPSTEIIGRLSLKTGLGVQTISNWFLSQEDTIDDFSDLDDNDSVIEIPLSD